MRRLELNILYVFTRAALIFLLSRHLSDLSYYLECARHTLQNGQWPFAHFPYEYPPLAFPFMLVPAFFHELLGYSSTDSYRVFFAIFLLPFDFLLFRGFRDSSALKSAGFLYLFLTTAMGQLLFDRFDLAVGFLVAWPFLGKEKEPGPSWGLGAALKVVPVFLLPLPVLLQKLRGKQAVSYALWAGLPLAFSVALVALVSDGQVSFLGYHTARGVQIESFLGSVVLAGKSFLALGQVTVENNFGAQHLSEIPGVRLLSRVLFWGLLLFTYGLLWVQRARWSLGSASWIVLSGFVTFGYVLSPQFLLWLIPLGLCAAAGVPAGSQRRVWLAVFGLVFLLTAVHFRHYWSYVNLERYSVALVLVRNLCLVLLWVLSWRWMRPTVLSSASS